MTAQRVVGSLKYHFHRFRASHWPEYLAVGPFRVRPSTMYLLTGLLLLTVAVWTGDITATLTLGIVNRTGGALALAGTSLVIFALAWKLARTLHDSTTRHLRHHTERTMASWPPVAPHAVQKIQRRSKP